ncbi:metallophosphoesterase family protein [Dichotomicrobium thermohalophilum]|uniref:3',5'-cyclic AMP phosphodiesterase CpdA n=1 Tax=Dichotomicrobium thermohalophilum TaxID=933063 RepID=A0A397Q5Z9_9HYPH|nr:metallophosphoesterase [Dichotomicrobium thermohalophilum]RIA54957.1 3',5'-cyclic AMP phosphodiesterase CpdA [Dichotomicrobium thermohalophilum]
MFTLAHLSDPHLGPLPRARFHQLLSKRLFGYVNWYRRQGVHRPEALDAILTDLRAHAPDHTAVTGDLVNLALPAEFTHALAWLRGLGEAGDVSVIPGNHDAYVPQWGGDGFRLWTDYMRSDARGAEFLESGSAIFPYVRVFGEVALIGTSTARATAPFIAAGRLGRAQLGQLEAALEALAAAGLTRVLLIHHPPLPGMASWRRGLHDARALRDVLERVGTELVLHGHEHRFTLNWLTWAGGITPIVGAPSASAAASATRPSGHGKPPAAYHLYRIERDKAGCVIHMTRRGLIEGGARVGDLGEMRLSPTRGDANTGEILRKNG